MSQSPVLWQSPTYAELNDGYAWLELATALATIRRVEALAEQLDREGADSDRLWNALDGRRPRRRSTRWTPRR